MYRILLLLGLSSLIVFSSCARNEERSAAYNAKQCPFCTQKPGVCSSCVGSGKCSYCQGTGNRKVVWPNIPEENIKNGSYTEACSFCKGSGKCSYCEGSAKCWVCKGSGAVSSWNFYEEYKGEKTK